MSAARIPGGWPAAAFSLHELACTGATPATGCVCASVPKRRPAAIIRHLDAAAEHRKRAEELATGVEALLGKFAALDVVPLDVLGRMERVIVKAHVANLARLSSVSEAALLALEPEAVEA